MSDTTTAPPRTDQAGGEPPGPRHRFSSRTSVLIGVGGLVVILALLVLLLLSSPVEDPAKIVIPGVSLTAFFQWLGNMGPIVQIPIILVVFGAVVGILLLLIEYAPRPGKRYFWIRLVASFAIPVLALMMLRPYQNAFVYVLGIAIVAGGVLFWVDYRAREGAGYLFQLVLFAAPAAVLLLIGLIYPFIATFVQSFYDKTGKEFIGFDNYVWVFTQPEGTWSVINTVIWVLICPTIATIVGLAYAVFIDRAAGEKYLKVLIFMPFAISFVGAGIIWKFVYDYRQGDQLGILNAIVTAFGGDPVAWLSVTPLVNSLLLMVVFIWSQTGLAMVILSAAIKAVPPEQNEAAELDGANAWQRFRNVTVPGIRSSIVVVVTTIAIAALKIYDIVAVMTGGRANTSVLAFEMVNQQQRFQSYGHAAALAVVLFIFVTPLIVFNIIQIRKQREIR
ncbi:MULTISPECIES: carbohydrate ABC transporter permease [Microbacterium]|jgi:alpha-glucoside transport system permease protein|uniref:carbohydrate ABC transporter permease n=1 Tax=Microbacterium TaxID=33882 RepID=UPI00198D3516|nr:MULTISPECIES: sugar ABC transporter permease [Microbacterium]MBD3758645.1 sugar ABC transporter permease [Microbacterium sp.]MBZ6373046.1 sugar ABC transporter permease [Microbacterium hominis]MCG7413671.1 sugar ABC transporter permease [Microbacterium aurum]